MNIELEDNEITTIRNALFAFSESLESDGLGEDEHGKNIAKLHQENITSILRKIRTPDIY